ncbi:MAG TPA: glycosyltransferase family 2 protein [Streptosporangiaceae bacterium]|nr:glycosyltransferase family 2 protein [Streptosporangiaceae bacterium]
MSARHRRPLIPVAPTILLGAIAGAEIGVHATLTRHGLAVSLPVYGYAVIGYLALKLGLACLYQPVVADSVDDYLLAAVVTAHNEDPGVFRQCLDSLLAQSRPPDVLTIIDDGSTAPDCFRMARASRAAFEALGITYHVIRHQQNRGKREGLANGFRVAWDADIYVCIDSDTVLKYDAMEKALQYFDSPRVQAVTGWVLAANWDFNLLTRLIDLRYANAFLGERAAYSRLGSVLCACGSLALYRGPVVRKYLGDFLSQQFLGRPCTYGDDRRLTYYCLREGQVLLAANAIAWTMVPQTMGHFLRQQLRWSKSFMRESWEMLTGMSVRRICWWLACLEITTWIAFTTVLVYVMLVRPIFTGHVSIASYLTATLLLSYARSGHYLRADHPHCGRFDRVITFALAPVYGLVHIVLLLPLRLVAVCTLRDNSWGTRSQVEVTA